MSDYTVAQVKAHLSAILEAVANGEEVVVTKRGKPVARILPEQPNPATIDWPKIDAFRDGLRKAKASVSVLRSHARY